MLDLNLIEKNGCQVMSSVDLAKLCGVRHDNFMAKVTKVLKELHLNFQGTYLDKSNRQSKCYYLPKREACLMAMSYSYELQAKVYDAWNHFKNIKNLSPIEQLRLQLQFMEDTQRKQQTLETQQIALIQDSVEKNKRLTKVEHAFNTRGCNIGYMPITDAHRTHGHKLSYNMFKQILIKYGVPSEILFIDTKYGRTVTTQVDIADTILCIKQFYKKINKTTKYYYSHIDFGSKLFKA